jgi:hypothetical protein
MCNSLAQRRQAEELKQGVKKSELKRTATVAELEAGPVSALNANQDAAMAQVLTLISYLQRFFRLLKLVLSLLCHFWQGSNVSRTGFSTFRPTHDAVLRVDSFADRARPGLDGAPAVDFSSFNAALAARGSAPVAVSSQITTHTLLPLPVPTPTVSLSASLLAPLAAAPPSSVLAGSGSLSGFDLETYKATAPLPRTTSLTAKAAIGDEGGGGA